MSPSKTRSFCEAWINIGIGFGVNFLANWLIFPLFNCHITLMDNLYIGLIYTVISLVRSYAIRRWMSKGD